MEFFTEFPELGRRSQMELRKGIDLAFRNFSREYGDGIEAFFDPLLFFLIRLEKLLLATPWPVILLVLGSLAWLGSRSWKLVVGSMIAFNNNNLSKTDFQKLIKEPKKEVRIFKAPPQGLILKKVYYD